MPYLTELAVVLAIVAVVLAIALLVRAGIDSWRALGWLLALLGVALLAWAGDQIARAWAALSGRVRKGHP